MYIASQPQYEIGDLSHDELRVIRQALKAFIEDMTVPEGDYERAKHLVNVLESSHAYRR